MRRKKRRNIFQVSVPYVQHMHMYCYIYCYYPLDCASRSGKGCPVGPPIRVRLRKGLPSWSANQSEAQERVAQLVRQNFKKFRRKNFLTCILKNFKRSHIPKVDPPGFLLRNRAELHAIYTASIC